jgi:pilus assembly protein CpaE
MPVNPKVLIIDEDPDSRVETRKAAQRSELDITGEVGFGAEAVTAALDLRPDLFLIAVEEPVTRPLDTVEALANVLPDTPFIFYASRNEPDAVRRAVLYGARDYLVKPLQGAGLTQAVVRAMEFEEKRQMRQAGQLAAAPVRGTVITVAGAKGGIGKSVLAVNLALALRAQTQAKVVIVDADTHFGDVATMLDITPTVTVADLLRDIKRLERPKVAEYLTEGPNGLLVLSGVRDDTDPWEAAGPDSGRKILELLSLTYDFIVVDTSGAMDSFVHAVADASTLLLMVTTGEVSSVRDTRAGLARLKSWRVHPDKIKLVLNRGARADGFQVNDLEETLERRVFWEMPRDREVGRSVQLGRPVVLARPASSVARNVTALAAAIGGSVHAKSNGNGHKPGLFGLRKSSSTREVVS